MSANYGWLIVAEGPFDVKIYTDLLGRFKISGAVVRSARGKSKVYRMNAWEESPGRDKNIISLKELETAQGREGFKGVIFVTDADSTQSLYENYAGYTSACRSPKLIDYDIWERPKQISGTNVMKLDSMIGINGRKLPILGLSVPVAGGGCLETDLMRSYGYPVESEDSYAVFSDVIKAASFSWVVPKPDDEADWWAPDKNGKARMDKFMYSALAEGFRVSHLEVKQIQAPQIIQDIKTSMSLSMA
ncbi:MAG: hypothetical protein LBG29_09590 [Synergistaceae bacterium]|nr:hypothetical protein [Synergistaceae bacterium]